MTEGCGSTEHCWTTAGWAGGGPAAKQRQDGVLGHLGGVCGRPVGSRTSAATGNLTKRKLA